MSQETQKSSAFSNTQDKALTLPNILTFGRLIMVPVFYFTLNHYETHSSLKIYSCIIFSLAMLTDFFDGYLARKMSQVSYLGKVLDPMADKLMVVAALLLLMHQELIFPWLVILLIGRELIINTIKNISMHMGFQLISSWAGKAKTLVQSFSIIFILLGMFPILKQSNIYAYDLGLWLLYIATLLSVYSAGEYFYILFKNIKNTAT